MNNINYIARPCNEKYYANAHTRRIMFITARVKIL